MKQDFKSQVILAIQRLSIEFPNGFFRDELAAAMGATYQHPGTDQKRLWDYLNYQNPSIAQIAEALRTGTTVGARRPLVYEVDKEIYKLVHQVIGPSSHEVVLGAAKALGGVFSAQAVMEACGWFGDAGRRRVSRVLSTGREFRSGGLSPPDRNLWVLRTDIRETVPVPGHLISSDLALCGGADTVDDRLVAIGSAVTAATHTVAWSELLMGDLLDAFVADIGDCCLPRYIPSLGKTLEIGSWWSMLVISDKDAALGEAWTSLVTGSAPGVALALSVDFWCALGARTGVSAARLSRGLYLGTNR